MYEKPLVKELNSTAEGVYAASGMEATTDCWTVGSETTQAWNGQAHIYLIKMEHSQSVVHTAEIVKLKLVFDKAIESAFAEDATNYNVSVAGNTVNVNRNLHGNGYNSGDKVTFKLFVKAIGDQAATEGLSEPTITYECDHHVNVQGGVD